MASTTDLALHRIRVQLAHVAPDVLLRHRLYMQIPGGGVRVTYGDSGVVSDDLLVNGLDGFRVRLHPAHLQVSPVWFQIYSPSLSLCALRLWGFVVGLQELTRYPPR